MNRRLHSVLCFLLLALVLTNGCKLSNNDKDKVVKITPEFSVGMFEELGNIRNFQFKIATIEKQECTNYTIDLSSSKNGNSLSLFISDLIAPAECNPGIAEAKASASIGFLANGNYSILVNLKNTIFNQGKLQVTDEEYSLNMESEDGLEIIQSKLKRIPGKTIWGYVGYQDKNAVGNQPEQFVKDLEAISRKSSLPDGYYGYFIMENNQNLVITPTPGFSFFKTFIFRYDGFLQDVEDLLLTYRNGSAGANMEIKLYTWEGEVL